MERTLSSAAEEAAPLQETVSDIQEPGAERMDRDLRESVRLFLSGLPEEPFTMPEFFETQPRASLSAVLEALRPYPRVDVYRRALPLIILYHTYATPEELEEFYREALHLDICVAGEVVPYLAISEHPANRLVRDLLSLESYRRIFENGFQSVGLAEQPDLFTGHHYADGRRALPETIRLILCLYFDYRNYFLGVGRRKHTAQIHRRAADLLAAMLQPEVLPSLVAELLPPAQMWRFPHRLWAFCRFADELSMISLSRQLDGPLRKRFDRRLLREALTLSNTFEAECIVHELKHDLSESAFLDTLISKKNSDLTYWLRLSEDGTRTYTAGTASATLRLSSAGRYGKFSLSTGKEALPPGTMEIILADAEFKKRRITRLIDRLQLHLTRQYLSSGPVPFAAALRDGNGERLRHIMISSVLFQQGRGPVFLFTENGPICADGRPYTLIPKSDLKLAHTGAMNEAEIRQWTDYFRQHHLEPLIWQFGPMR